MDDTEQRLAALERTLRKLMNLLDDLDVVAGGHPGGPAWHWRRQLDELREEFDTP